MLSINIGADLETSWQTTQLYFNIIEEKNTEAVMSLQKTHLFT